jgi:predicted Rossmann fold nucleotide-binding protein DprA/Smf involved in DNA uptake
MPQVPEVSAIVEQVKTRIKHIEDELARHERLSDELERLRDALGRLEGAARSRVTGGRRGRRQAATPAAAAPPADAAGRASAPARAPRGQNKAKVLEALKNGPMTASEIAEATGIATGTVSTLLTKLAKTGEVGKADRGYKLPDKSRDAAAESAREEAVVQTRDS